MKAYAKTDVGKKRSMNQDFFYCSEDVVGSFRNLLLQMVWEAIKQETMLPNCVYQAWWNLSENQGTKRL